MTEQSGEGPEKLHKRFYPTFVHTEAGPTHFVSGNGTEENPFEPQGGTSIREALIDSQETALSGKREKVFFLFNRNIVGVDENMEVTVSQQEGGLPSDPQAIQKEAEKLKKEGKRAATPEEIREFTKSLKPGFDFKGMLKKILGK